MPELRVAILGQGLAGSLLSFRLTELGIDHMVFDLGHVGSASLAAAGLVNPVTGRRFVLVPRYAECVAGFSIYDRLSAKLHRTLVRPLVIYRDLTEIETRNRWDLRRLDSAYSPYLGEPVASKAVTGSANLRATFLGPTHGAFRVDLPGLITAWRQVLRESAQIEEKAVARADLTFNAGGMQLGGSTFSYVVDARGAASAKTGLWVDVPWRLTKGEALRFADPAWSREAATKLDGNFYAPLGEGDDVWFGGTSEDHYKDEGSSDATQGALLNSLAADFRRPLGPVEQLAAVRPTVRDRQWRVQRHPQHRGLILCNGLGTRGALDAPSAIAACLSIIQA